MATELALRTSELAEEISLGMKYGSLAYASGMVPTGVKNEAQAQYLCTFAVSIGIHPARATVALWIPQGGRPTLYAKTCNEIILGKGGFIETVEESDEVVVLKGVRKDGRSKVERVERSEFKHLHSRDTWKNYPKRMLRAAAVRNLAADLFADYLAGADVGDPGDFEPEHRQLASQAVDSHAPAAMPAAMKKLTTKLSPAAAIQGMRNDSSDAAAEALAERYAPGHQILAPESKPAAERPVATVTPIRSEPLPMEEKRKIWAQAFPIERLVEPAKETGQASTEVIDLSNRAHRALVTDAFTELNLSGAWRREHRSKLELYLRSRKDVFARASDVLAAVSDYIDALPRGVNHDPA